jgi:hypothetical protein
MLLGSLAKSMLMRAVQKKAGVARIGTIPAALLTTGASLALTHGRRPIGLALAGVGGLLLWQEIERERRLQLIAGGAGDGTATTGAMQPVAKPVRAPAPLVSGVSAATKRR